MAISKIMQAKQPITQTFGRKLFINWKDIYAQYGLVGHNGVDFGCKAGTELFAWLEGRVSVENTYKKWYGLSITIIKDRWESWKSEIIYGHLSKVFVITGDIVKVGDKIGLSGGNPSSPTSWTSTNSHLHFGLRFRDKYSKVLTRDNWYKWWIDPMPYFE
jgi:murein DD-endopeptidase MepM/ murein hydrolase activator NlpD